MYKYHTLIVSISEQSSKPNDKFPKWIFFSVVFLFSDYCFHFPALFFMPWERLPDNDSPTQALDHFCVDDNYVIILYIDLFCLCYWFSPIETCWYFVRIRFGIDVTQRDFFLFFFNVLLSRSHERTRKRIYNACLLVKISVCGEKCENRIGKYIYILT